MGQYFTRFVSLLISLHGYLFEWLQQWRRQSQGRCAMLSDVFILQRSEMKSTSVVVVCLMIGFYVPLGAVWLLLPSWLKINQ